MRSRSEARLRSSWRSDATRGHDRQRWSAWLDFSPSRMSYRGWVHVQRRSDCALHFCLRACNTDRRVFISRKISQLILDCMPSVATSRGYSRHSAPQADAGWARGPSKHCVACLITAIVQSSSKVVLAFYLLTSCGSEGSNARELRSAPSCCL